MSASLQRRLLSLAICAGLLGLVAIVYAQTRSFAFLNYDDRAYVVANPKVNHGLSWESVAWAFTKKHAENWHPLTSLSHMLDCQLFGITPSEPHVINALLHALAAVLLFLFLRRATNRTWESAFVAALFAVHPLHVESVAWVAERKDVLSGVFFMLTLLAYSRYLDRRSASSYLLALFVFACGLMAKPMLVTMPGVLLLLDYWPFRRSERPETGGRSSLVLLLLDKVPFFALSLSCAVITLRVQTTAVSTLQSLPLGWRVENAVVSYVVYLAQFFWPAKLAAFYPHPQGSLGWIPVTGCAFCLVAISAAAWRLRRSDPWFVMGWIWYLVMLLPVIGILQVGLQAHADRYSYLPSVGLAIALGWGIAHLAERLPRWRIALPIAGAIAISVLAAVARTQAGYWRDDQTLWTHALAVTEDNDVAHNNLGNVLINSRDFAGAISHFSAALEIRSRSGETQYGTGAALSHNNLGIAYFNEGDVDEAIDDYRKALEIWPDYADAHYNLGVALAEQGKRDEAIEEWKWAVAIAPDDNQIRGNLAYALLQKGDVAAAIKQYETALRTDRDDADALNNLAWILSTNNDPSARDGGRAISLAQRALELAGGRDVAILGRDPVPAALRTLAAAYAEAGKFEDARATAQRALDLAKEENDSNAVQTLRADLGRYQAREPLRESNY